MAKKILLVDDSPTIRTIIKLYLMGRPIEFVEAADGAEGLKISEKNVLDLVIADFNMPAVNGLDFVRTLRAHSDEKRRKTPVILLTADKDASLKAKALEVGVNAFAQKPISREHLVEAVNKLLGAE
jgi:two-component system, chemotaxis family, chemotaxis protein CheY